MANQEKQNDTVSFKTVQLFKHQTLGIGSYGKVCKAKCDDLLCAAKLIHETLFDPKLQKQATPQEEHRLPMRRFEQECDFLSTIRHPNIVQYLGIYRDSDTGLPALLMELMDDSLTHFLESSTQPIPYHIQVNICHDITLALSFLHSNSIVHRDLSSNNVLLIGNAVRAKVTDFGMARLGDQNPRATHFTFTMCPGTDVYMPPEAVQDKPVYTEKIDCFSFGVITLQILTRQFPKPGDRRKRIEINHPGMPSGTFEMVISEVERRQNHISIIDPNHTLLQVSLDCLKDRDVERPSAQQLCERVAALKESPQFNESVKAAEERNRASKKERGDTKEKANREQQTQQVQDLQQIIRSQISHLAEKDQALKEKDGTIAAGEQQIRELLRDVNRLEREKDEATEEKDRQILAYQQKEREKIKVIEDKERQLGKVNQRLEECERELAQFQKQITAPVTKAATLPRRKQKCRRGITLTWKTGAKAPRRASSIYNAVADSKVLYIRAMFSIHTYTTSTSSWSQLPDCPTYSCPLVIVNDLLTLVGGIRSGRRTNHLFSLTEEGRGRRWTEEFPPMLEKEACSTALCTGTFLIVAGGISETSRTLQTVEVLSTETLQWSIAASLPQSQPMTYAMGAVCNNHVYILSVDNRSKSMHTCPVSALIQSCQSRPTEDVWNKGATPPLTRTTCVSILGRLLTIGGVSSRRQITTAVHMYNPDSDSWEVISHMATPRQDCFAAALPNNQLMVVGGETESGETNSVEIASVE